MGKKTDTSQETQCKTYSSKSPSALDIFHSKPQLIWKIISIILLLSLVGSLSGKVSKEDYESLKNDYESMQDNHEALQEKYDSLQSRYDEIESGFKTTQTTLNDTLSAYEEYQKRMKPFDSLTDDELNTVASRITQTLEEKQAEESAKQAATEAQAIQQQTQGSMVWIPRSGSKYHSNSSCSNMKNPSQVSISQAQASGYEPCKKCY